MIKYELVCKQCNITFDSWFATSKEYDKLKKKKLLTCYSCGSLKFKKNLMAPKLIKKLDHEKTEKEQLKYKKIKKKITEYQNFIKTNFEYVGDNFAYEARLIHYKDKIKKKSVYGTATKKDLKELKEEGIDTQLIPWIEENNN